MKCKHRKELNHQSNLKCGKELKCPEVEPLKGAEMSVEVKVLKLVDVSVEDQALKELKGLLR